MRIKNIISVIAAAAIAAGSFSGCAGTAASSSSKAGQNKTITYMAMWNENEAQATVAKQAIADFEAANPGVTVKVTWGGRDIRKTLKTSIDAGQQVDVVENSPDWLYPNLGTKYLLKLDSYMNKVYPTTENKAFKDTLLPVMTKFASTYAGDNSYYYVPNQPSVAAIFYNKDLFKKAGITTVPSSWDEFLGACAKLKAAGIAPLTVDDAYYGILYGQYLAEAKGDVWAGKLFSDKTGENWSDPAVSQFAKAFEELYKKGYFTTTTGSNKYPAAQQELALGKAAMYMNGSWFPNEVASTAGPDFNWGVMAFPNVPNGQYNNKNMMLISQGYAVCSKSKDPDLAFKLITYFMDKKTQQAFADKAACIPCTVGSTWPKALKDLGPMFNSMYNTFAWGGAKNPDSDFTSVVDGDFAKLISGKLTSDQFVSDLKTKAKR
ncbi:MAG TPA: extracellular solute-binding protein [Caproicibacter sp.]|nr:extracellular solute-binding protein [Caproicibacter sp.]